MLKTLLFPTTIPQQHTIRQLLLFFDEVFQYAPAEDSIAPQKALENFHHYAPVPFAERLDAFQRLFNSIKKNRAEYYGGGLSQLSQKAAIDLDEAAVWQLIKTLSPKEVQSKSYETLDQARLFLKLAEIFDQEEHEIRQELSTISHKNRALLEELKGELEELEEIDLHLPPSPTAAASPEMLTRAWGHLFLADRQAADFWILTTSRETFEYVSDHASPLINHTPENLLSLHIPDITAYSEDIFTGKHAEWKKNLRDLCKSFEEKLHEAALKGCSPNNSLAPALMSWNEHTRKHFAGSSNAMQIDFYLFPQTLRQLFMKIVKTGSLQEPESTASAHAIIAVLQPAPEG